MSQNLTLVERAQAAASAAISSAIKVSADKDYISGVYQQIQSYKIPSINSTKEAIRQVLIGKGLQCPSSVSFSDYTRLIDNNLYSDKMWQKYYQCTSANTDLKLWAGHPISWSPSVSSWVKAYYVIPNLPYKGFVPEIGKIYNTDTRLIISALSAFYNYPTTGDNQLPNGNQSSGNNQITSIPAVDNVYSFTVTGDLGYTNGTYILEDVSTLGTNRRWIGLSGINSLTEEEWYQYMYYDSQWNNCWVIGISNVGYLYDNYAVFTYADNPFATSAVWYDGSTWGQGNIQIEEDVSFTITQYISSSIETSGASSGQISVSNIIGYNIVAEDMYQNTADGGWNFIDNTQTFNNKPVYSYDNSYFLVLVHNSSMNSYQWCLCQESDWNLLKNNSISQELFIEYNYYDTYGSCGNNPNISPDKAQWFSTAGGIDSITPIYR